MTDFTQILDAVDQMIAAAEKESAPECVLRGSLSSWRLLRAALSAQSTGSGGVTAEPVAWAYDWQSAPQFWQLVVSPVAPDRSRNDVRNIRPLYEHPPVAAEPIAGNLRPDFTEYDIAQDMIQAGRYAANLNDGTLAAIYLAMRSAEIAGTPPAGSGETIRHDIKCHCAGGYGPNPECGACGGSGCISGPVELSPASPAGDLISLSAGATQGLCVLWPNSPLYLRDDTRNGWGLLSNHHKTSAEAASNAQFFAGLWNAYRSGRLIEAAPAAPRKGPSASDLIQAIHENVSSVTGAGGVTWVDYTQVQEVITALLTPADRGETQAVGDGADV